jgi:preprotein translocase subunit SecY
MASVAEQLASNISLSALKSATELRKRIWFTILALIVYRFGTYLPLPGIDIDALRQIFEQNQSGIIGIFNMFSGGAVGRMAIFSLGIMPYITASIIIQLIVPVVPSLNYLKKEAGERGRRQINQYTRYATVFLATIQAWGIAVGLEGATGVVVDPGAFFKVSAVITLVGGTIFLMWLGEQITSNGLGNGISLLIFAGIVAELPSALSIGLMFGLLLLVLATITFVVFIERAQRRLLVQYPKRQVGNKMFGGDNSHLPLKLNTSGVIPAIFASSLLLMPITIANFSAGQGPDWVNSITTLLGRGQPLYMIIYASLIVFFCYFYTAIVFNPEDTADNLKKQGGFIPGVRPGERTAQYIDYVLTRLTVVGSIYLVLVCLLPEFLISRYAVPFYFGGTSVLIIVNVAMDTMTQFQGYLFAHQYEGLLKKSKLGSRKR